MKRIVSVSLIGTLLACLIVPTSIDVTAAGKEIRYEKGEFDTFFEQDYDLTQRNYNTFTSVAGSDIAPNDCRCSITSDILHGYNRVLKMGYTQKENEKATGFNTFFTLFGKNLSDISNKGGTLEIAFDFYPYGWESGSVIPLDKKLFFQIAGKQGNYFVVQDKNAIQEPNANAIVELDSYPDSELSGYKRIQFQVELNQKEAQETDAITFWFYNGFGMNTAYLDNFSVKYCGQEVIHDGTFEKFDLSDFACPKVENQNPLENYGVSSHSSMMEYSPAVLKKIDEDAVLCMQSGQGTRMGANAGSLVDFTLGGQALFESEGYYLIEMDIRFEGSEIKEMSPLTMEFSNFTSSGTARDSQFFADGGVLYSNLPDSASKEGYKRFSYIINVTEEEVQDYDCLCLVFDTDNGQNTLLIDNLVIKEAGNFQAQIYGVSHETIDRANRENLIVATNLGDLDTELYLTFEDNMELVDPAFYQQQAGIYEIDCALFNQYTYDGEYTLHIQAEDRMDTEVTFEVSGESNMPRAGEWKYIYGGKGNLEIDVDLKSAEIYDVKHEALTLNENEYELNDDKNSLILKAEYMEGLTEKENQFQVSTSEGDFSFKVILGEEENSNGYIILIGASFVAIAVVGMAAIGIIKKGKKNSDSKETDR